MKKSSTQIAKRTENDQAFSLNRLMLEVRLPDQYRYAAMRRDLTLTFKEATLNLDL